MAAPVNAPLLAALQAIGVATQADVLAAVAPLATQAGLLAAVAPLATQAGLLAAVAPLATQADVLAAVAPLATQTNAMQVQLNALAAQVAALPTLVQINAAIAAALAPHNAPAVAAAASAIALDIAVARRHNDRDNRGVAFAVVPRSDGTPPPHWPRASTATRSSRAPSQRSTAYLGTTGCRTARPRPCSRAATRSRSTSARRAREPHSPWA